MNDADFLRWWDGCAWAKSDPALEQWPRARLARIAELERQKEQTVNLLRQWDQMKARIACLKKENAGLTAALHGHR